MHSLIGSAMTRGWPSLNRTTAVAMVLIQALAITLLMQPVLMPVAAIALAGWVAPRMKLMLPLPVGVSFATIVLINVIQHQFREEEFVAMGFIGSKLAYEVACCCIACQLLLLFVKKYATQLPIWYLAISGTSMVFSGDIRVTYQNNAIMMWVVVAYLVCWSGFAISCRTRTVQSTRRIWIRQTAIIGVIFTSVAAGRLLALTYQKYANRLEFWMTEYLYQGRISRAGNGFSGKGGLHDITELKQNSGNEVALKIDATFFPEYLRGRVFTQFHLRRWQPSDPIEIITPLIDHPPLRPLYPDESVYQLTKDWPVAPRVMTVWPFDQNSSAHFFLPLGAAVLACDGKSIKRDGNGILERDSKSILDSYQALVGAPPPVPPESVDPVFLSLPHRLNPIVNKTAEDVFAAAQTTQEKIRAVEAFFHNNFSYKLGLRIPRGADRLAYFLSVRPPAHCEYFATATTILLRLANVPARYVTGYVVTGRNPIDGSYYALRRDAHAWVEAYDDEQQQWVIVESTPMEGVPARNKQTSFKSATNIGWGTTLQISEFLRSGIIWVIGQRYGRMILVLAPVAGAVYVLLKLYLAKFFTGWRREVRVNPAFAPLARERVRMDRFLSRRGVQRAPEESLLHFADRLESEAELSTSSLLAGWYRHYVELRFQDRPLTPDAVTEIRNSRRTLSRTTKAAP